MPDAPQTTVQTLKTEGRLKEFDPDSLRKHQTTDRIADLERRIAALERLDLASLLGARGCICPAGAEVSCRGVGCPRREWKTTAPGRDVLDRPSR